MAKSKLKLHLEISDNGVFPTVSVGRSKLQLPIINWRIENKQGEVGETLTVVIQTSDFDLIPKDARNRLPILFPTDFPK